MFIETSSIIAVIIVLIVAYLAFRKSDAQKHAEEETIRSVERKRIHDIDLEKNRVIYEKQKKIVKDYFSDYIKNLFNNREKISEAELLKLLAKDFPHYNNGTEMTSCWSLVTAKLIKIQKKNEYDFDRTRYFIVGDAIYE